MTAKFATAYTFTMDTSVTAIRIQLHQMDAPEGDRAARQMAAMTYKLAQRLEAMAGAEMLTFAVQPDRRGTVTMELVVDAAGIGQIDDDIAVEIAMEACLDCGILYRDCA